MSEKNDVLVQVDHLKKYFPVKGLKGPGVQAVEDISIFINRGETLGLVGESDIDLLQLKHHTLVPGRIQFP